MKTPRFFWEGTHGRKATSDDTDALLRQLTREGAQMLARQERMWESVKRAIEGKRRRRRGE